MPSFQYARLALQAALVGSGTAFRPSSGASKEVSTQKNPTKLHLGCGAKYIEGFFHIDGNPHQHVDLQGPVDNLPFLNDDSVELIYAAHLLEHFGRNEVDAVLAEWYRVLKPGGVLRLAVPDIGVACHLYVKGYLQNGLPDILGLMMGGQRDQYDYHKMAFDEPSLTVRLKKIGFTEVRPWDWRKTEHKHIDDYSQAYLPHMDKENGILISLNLEAVK